MKKKRLLIEAVFVFSVLPAFLQWWLMWIFNSELGAAELFALMWPVFLADAIVTAMGILTVLTMEGDA